VLALLGRYDDEGPGFVHRTGRAAPGRRSGDVSFAVVEQGGRPIVWRYDPGSR
jgi:hypothetical protein